MNYYLKAFDLVIKSEFPFQAISHLEKGFFDIEVVRGKVPDTLKESTYKGVNFENNAHSFLLRIPTVAKFLIQEGKRIVIDPLPQAENREIELFFLGSVMAVVLLQRDILPFHGSAFQKGDKCIIISGKSGAGKSTLLHHFVKQGYKALTDDVGALSVKDGQVVLTPSYPSSKIWNDIMDVYDYDEKDTLQVRPSIRKYRYSLEKDFCYQSLPIEAIYILNQANDEHFSFKEEKGINKFTTLQKNIYRPLFPKALKKEKLTFSILNRLAQQISLFRITRSSSLKQHDAFNRFAQETMLK